MEAIIVLESGYLIHQGMKFYDGSNHAIPTTCDDGWFPNDAILRVVNRNNGKIYPWADGKGWEPGFGRLGGRPGSDAERGRAEFPMIYSRADRAVLTILMRIWNPMVIRKVTRRCIERPDQRS